MEELEVKEVIEQKAPEQQEEQVEAKPAVDYEARARTEGWCPQDQWRGDPEEWVDAKQFLRISSIIGPLKTSLRKADERNGLLLKDIERIKEETRKAERSRMEQEMAHAKALRKEAFESGDYTKMEQAEQIAEQIRNRQIDLERPSTPAANPVFTDWVSNNSWYSNPAAQIEADNAGIRITQEITGGEQRQLTPWEYKYVLEKVANEVGVKYSANRPAPAAPVVNQVKAPANSGGSRQRARTFADLSADEKDTFRQFQRHGIYKNTGDIEKDAKDYIRELDASSTVYTIR